MNNNLTLSVTLTGDGRQLSGTLRDAQGDVREFSATTERESRKAETALTAPGRSATTVSEHLRETQREARSFGTEAARGGREANQALAQTGQQAQTTTSHFNSLRRMVGLALGAFSVRQVAGMADGWSDMQSVVGAAIGDMSEAGDMMRRITDIANASYAPLQQTARTYASNVSALRDLGRSADDAASYTESLNHHLVLTATRGQQAESVQNALSRAMAVGRLQADGLETVLANGGEVAQSLANQLGVTVSQLRGLATEGKITGDVIASALIGSLDDVRDRAGEMPATIEDGFVRIGTSATRLVGELDQALGTSEGVAGILIGVADALTATIDPLINNIETLQSGITIVGVAAGAYVTYRSVLIAATAAQWAFNTAVRANPLGLAITLLGAAAGALITYRQEVTLAGSESFQTSLDVDGLTGSFHLLTEAQQENRRASIVGDLIEMRMEAGKLGAELVEVSRLVRNSGQLTPEGGALPIASADDIARGRELREELGTILANIGAGTDLLNEYDSIMSDLGQTTSGTASRTRELADASTASSKAAREAAAHAKELTKSTEAQANALEELYNRLRPGRRETVQLARDIQTLNLALAMGTGNIAQNIQMMGLLQQQYIEAQNDTDDLADKTVKAAFTMEGAFDELRLNGLRRLDSGFADLWLGAVDGSRNASDTIKRVWDQTLAELLHMSLSRPVTVQLATSMGFGGSGQQAGSGSQSLGGMPSFSNMMDGSGAIANAYRAFQGTGSTYAGTFGSELAVQTEGGLRAGFDSFAASGLGNAALGIGGGIAGGYAGTEIGSSVFGKNANSSYGATGGAIAGQAMIPIPGLGAAIGGFVGGLADSLFGSGKKSYDFDFVQGQHSYVFGDETSAFGDSGLTNLSDFKLGEQQDALKEMLSAMADFDNQLAASAIPERFDAMKASIDGFTHSGPDDLFETRLRQMITGGQVLAADAIASIVDPEALSQAMLGALQLEGIGQQLGGQVLDDITAEIERFSGNSVVDAIARMTDAAMAADLLASASQGLNLQFDITAAGAVTAAGSIAEIVGGVQNLTSIQQGYYQATFSETERLNHAQIDLRASLAGVTDQVPTTVAELRNMVEAQNLNDAAAGELAVRLMQLAPALQETNAAVRDAIEQQYQESLGRAPDASGIDYWFNQVATGSATLERALGAIASSSEAAEYAANSAASGIDTMADALRERESLERQLLQAQGNTAELRRRELAATDPSNRALQQRIWHINDERDVIAQAQRQQQERNRAIDQEASAMARARDQLASFGVGITGYIDNLRGTDAGLASPADQLAASSQAFYEQYDKAMGGDRDAMNSITQYADRFIDAQKGWSASGAQTVATIDKVAGMLGQLPDKLSAEQFLANEFRDALGQQTTDLLAGHETITGRLADNFGRIDLNSDGLIDWSEFYAAFSHLADEATLRQVFGALDNNGSGAIDKLEAISLGTQSLVSYWANQQPASVQDAISKISDMYETALNREPDLPGLQYWIDEWLSGASLKTISESIQQHIGKDGGATTGGSTGGSDGGSGSSQTAAQRWISQQNTQTQGWASNIESIYKDSHDRSATVDDLKYWTAQMQGSAGASMGTVNDFIRGAGYVNRYADVRNAWNTRKDYWQERSGAANVNEFGIWHAKNLGIAEGRKFANGGWTGPGGKWDEAGIVHAEEFVVRSEVVKQPGVREMLEGLNREGVRKPTPIPRTPMFSPNNQQNWVRDLLNENIKLRADINKLMSDSNKHLAAANNQRGAAAKGQIGAIERGNKMLKKLEDDKRLEATKR